MFTDTKNLANLTVNTTNAASKQNNNYTYDEDKFKLKKIWKPILRLMFRKSTLTKNGKTGNNSSTILNNVNLNNATQYTSANKDGVAELEDSSYITHKLPLAELWQQQQQKEQTSFKHETPSQPSELISKASIDKAPLDTCTNCVYGRNCQHTMDLKESTHPQADPNSNTHFHHHQQNFNYFDAVWSDNGTEEFDEHALREWLWQNSWQFADNATMC